MSRYLKDYFNTKCLWRCPDCKRFCEWEEDHTGYHVCGRCSKIWGTAPKEEDYFPDYDDGTEDYQIEVLTRTRREGGLNKFIEECPCEAPGADGTKEHGTFSNLVFSYKREDGTRAGTYTFPCTNHWKNYYYSSVFVFECVVVGKDRFKIMPGPWIDRWEVKGSKGDLWTVAKKQDGTYGCSCPGWKFKPKPKPNCKHIRAIITAMNMGVIPAQKTENREQTVLTRVNKTLPETFIEPEIKAEVDNEFFQVKRKFRFED